MVSAMSVYILHFSPSYRHAAHYTGWAADVAPRVYAHLHGRGARLTQVAKDAGCEMILVRVWEGASRTDERRLKNNGHIKRHCPICCGLAVQMPLLLGEPAYVPCDSLPELSAIADIPVSSTYPTFF